jgi:hypothetical protein
MKLKFKNIAYSLITLALSLLFVVKFAGPALLRMYIETGIGSCQKIPILCTVPSEHIAKAQINQEYLGQLTPYRSPKINILLPKNFSVVQEKIKKVYYKRKKRLPAEDIIYLLYENPDFFVNLFPQVKKQGINNNYDFLRRLMNANMGNLKGLSDTFFMVMKGIFIPDLGDQKNAKMIQADIGQQRAFINYNSSGSRNYFDCNIIDNDGSFYKIYIKDANANLDLEKVLTIISSLGKNTLN